MRFDESTVSKNLQALTSLIKERVLLSAVVGQKVKLMRQGSTLKGLCPFHQEKTPSFVVHDKTGYFHCFGCGARGDVFEFIQKTENLRFIEVIKQLSQKLGIQSQDFFSTPVTQKDSSSYEANARFCDWSMAQLLHPVYGRDALKYLTSRGLNTQSIDHFKIGYCPKNKDLFQAFLQQSCLDKELFKRLGILKSYGRSEYCAFEGRVLFPIRNVRHQVVGFGGRLIGESPGVKYLNTAANVLFKKKECLYGVEHVKRSSSKTLFIAEGYFDAVALHQYGVPNAVATLGTALTAEQLSLAFGRLQMEKLVLCFDGDDAGRRAMHKAALSIAPLLQIGQSVGFIVMPPGTDPAEAVRQGSIQENLSSIKPMQDILFDALTGLLRFDRPENCAQVEARIHNLLEQIPVYSLRKYYRAALLSELKRRVFLAKQPYFRQAKNDISLPLLKRNVSDWLCIYNATLLLYCPALKDRPGVEEDLLRIAPEDQTLLLFKDYLYDTLYHASFREGVSEVSLKECLGECVEKDFFPKEMLNCFPLCDDQREEKIERYYLVWRECNELLSTISFWEERKDVSRETVRDAFAYHEAVFALEKRLEKCRKHLIQVLEKDQKV